MLKVKYESVPFGKMDELERLENSFKILTILCIITGWIMPENEDVQNVLIDQLSKKMAESYANVNADEVGYAFRNNTTVKDWGKTLNLAMIDEVMIPYMNQRYELSQMEDRMKKPLMLPAPEIKMTDEELYTATFACYKALGKYHLIPESIYYYLFKTGKLRLTNDEKREIQKRVTEPGEEGRLICRKIAVAEYFDKIIKEQNTDTTDAAWLEFGRKFVKNFPPNSIYETIAKTTSIRKSLVETYLVMVKNKTIDKLEYQPEGKQNRLLELAREQNKGDHQAPQAQGMSDSEMIEFCKAILAIEKLSNDNNL